MADERNDHDLVRECLGGRVEAFDELVRRYERPVFNAVLRMVRNRDDAADLSQEAFVRAYRRLASFDERFKFYSWIYGIAIHAAINHVRRRRELSPLDREPESPARSDDAGRDESAARVREAVMRLSPEYRAVVVLRHYLDLSYREIAEAIGVPEKTVRSRLFSARRNLRELLDPERGER